MRKVALVCVLALAFMVIDGQTNVKTKVAPLKKTLTSIKDKQKDTRHKLNEIRSDLRDARDEVQSLDVRMERVEDRIHNTQDRIDGLNQTISRLGKELEAASADYKIKSERAKERLQYIRMHGQTTVVSAILRASSLNELASRKYILETVARNDRLLFEDVRNLRDEIATKKKQNEQARADTRGLLVTQRLQHAEMNEVLKDKQAIFNRLTDKAADVQGMLERLNRQEDEIEAKIQGFMMQNIGGGSRPGALLLPVNGRFASPFGMRFHPILHKMRMHSGQDIAAPYGTPIRAAAGGTIVTAGWMGGYGNVVIISHGGGMTTLYGHCSSIVVRSGRVSRGQVIARVGSTGLSTGPHCHFEVAINGQKVNPRKYL